MAWEPWTHRRRRLAGLLTKARIPIFAGRYHLPYCGLITPFPSDYSLPPWAPFVLEPLSRMFPGTFVDVGVNIGQTLLLVKDFDPRWEYIGFEANPISLSISRELAKANRLEAYRLVPAGLSDGAGLLEMESNNETDDAASLISGFRKPDLMKLRSLVAVIDGDTALRSIGSEKIGILKIDVEGGELEVLRGLTTCLAESRPLVVCEVLPLHDSKSVGDFRVGRQRAVEQLLLEQQFSIFRMEPPSSVRLLARVPDDGDVKFTDYLFVPNERKPEFEAAMTSHGIAVVSG